MKQWIGKSGNMWKMFIIPIIVVLFLSAGYIAQVSQGEVCSDVLFIEVEGTELFDVVIDIYSDIEKAYVHEPIETFVIYGPIYGSYSFKFVDLDQELTSIVIGASISGDAYFGKVYKELDIDIPEEFEIREVDFDLLFSRTNEETIYPRYPIRLVFIAIVIVIGAMFIPRWYIRRQGKK